MKTKSLFISTIAMVVMLVVALSVGTFAWFASQNEIDATGATVGSAEANDSAIGLGWSDSTATANAVSLGSGGSNLRPMIPTTQPSTAIDAETGIPNLVFNEALLRSDSTGTKVIGSSRDATPWRQNDGTANPQTNAGSLYIGNLNPNTVTISTIVNIDTENNTNLNELLRVSIYVKGTGASDQAQYIGTWGGTQDAYVYKFSSTDEGALPSSIEVDGEDGNALENKIATGDPGASFTLAGNAESGVKQVFIYAWLEGTKLDITNMTRAAARFSVKFNAVTNNP